MIFRVKKVGVYIHHRLLLRNRFCSGVFTLEHFYFSDLFVFIKNDITFVFKFDKMAKKKYTVVEVALLATAFNKSTQTINRWILQNNDILTSERAKSALLKLKK